MDPEAVKMDELSGMESKKQNTWQVFRNDIKTARERATGFIEPLINWAFAFTQQGAERRATFLIVSFMVLWLGLAMLAHPPGLNNGSLMIQLLDAIFAADVLHHLLVLGLGLWLALRLAARYLDDIFELDNLSVAEKFIRSASFSGYYQRLKIRDGVVPSEYQESPMFRIGGPGRVDVHLENAALFERLDGTPHVISPTSKRFAVLDGFERLRSVVDLRDQVIELTVDGRTQDGVPVTAKDVRLVYSIYRGVQGDTGTHKFQQPYPFSEQAVLDLVYKQGKDPLVIKAISDSIRSELRQFISRHTLSEFLANAECGSSFVPRDQLTDLFYDYAKEFSKQAEKRGVELHWIGVGTWVTPSQIIPERQLEAWKLSCDNRLRCSEQSLSHCRKESRLIELIRLIDEVPNTFYNLIQLNTSPEQIMRRLVLDYREKLREAKDLYQNQQQPIPPELDTAIRHLTLLAAIRINNERP